MSDAAFQIDRLIAKIDQVLSAQVSKILHHPNFQSLEASWRSLRRLVVLSSQESNVKVKLLNVRWRELAKDFDRAADFDQSKLFDLIYSEEFDMPGGQPFGLLVGDFVIGDPSMGLFNDIATLQNVAGVAAAAFSPFIAAPHPALFGFDDFTDFGRDPSLDFLQKKNENPMWRNLRTQSDTRFLGLCLPRVLVRRPYKPEIKARTDGFVFYEQLEPNDTHLLWGNIAYIFAETVLKQYMQSGWFADIRGVREDDLSSGFVNDLPFLAFETDKHDIASQPALDIRLNDFQEQALSEAGFIPLMPLPYTQHTVFNSNQSLHSPPEYSRKAANQNARISSMLQYILCISRFAHYLKAIIRDSVGEISTTDTLRQKLENWLSQYAIGNEDASDMLKAKHPLRSSAVSVHEVPGKPGVFGCVMHLQPHFQLDDVSASFQLLADMNIKNNQPNS